MDERRKWAFWAFCLLAAAVILVPTSSLLSALQRYGRFLGGFEPGTLRPTRPHGVPHRLPQGGAPAARLHFAEFRLKAPKAKAVELVGDFNGWKTGTLPLAVQGSSWEVLVPLPPGRYRYLFLVDGKQEPDPEATQVEDESGRWVSVREVRP